MYSCIVEGITHML